ncbi:MAG: hypothetical protein ACM3ST_08025 [Bdellovibrio bacteriovorus]
MQIAPILTAAALVLSTGLAQAASPADACANLGAARSALVGMIDEADATKLDGYVEKIQAASAALDADLAAMAGGPDAAKADAFKPVWEAFKNTRETEIIPAVKAGDKAKAKELATGVQAGRMKEMKAAMGCQ